MVRKNIPDIYPYFKLLVQDSYQKGYYHKNTLKDISSVNLKFKSDLFSKNSIRKNKIIINDEKKEILNILNSFFKIFNINKISK